MSEGARAIVVAHGDLAHGLVSAVACIAGEPAAAHLLPMSNRTLGGAELAEALRQAVASFGAGVVFTDLPAGSCTVAARRVAHALPGLAVVTGVNLPLLLAFALAPRGGALALPVVVDKARAALLLAEEGSHVD